MAHDEMIPSPDYNTFGTVIHWPIGAEPPEWLTQSADGCCELSPENGYRRFQRYKLNAGQINELAAARAGGVNWQAVEA